MYLKFKLKKIDLKLVLALIPLYLLNGGTAEFFKIEIITTLVLFGSFGGWVLLVLLEDRNFLNNLVRLIWPIAVCLLMLIFFSLFPHQAVRMSSSINNLCFLMIIVAIFYYYIEVDENNNKQYLLIFWTIDILISSVYSVIRLLEYPVLARYLATGHAGKYTTIDARGIVSYAVVYGLALLMPALLYKISKVQKKHKIFWVMFMLLCFSAIYYAQFTLALSLGIIAVGAFFIIYSSSSKHRTLHKLVIFSAFTVLLLFMDVILLKIIDSNVLPYEVNIRVKEIYAFLYSDNRSSDMDLISRLMLYSSSFEAIWLNWGLGKILLGKGVVGGHSEILDAIANYGLVYFLFLVAFFIQYFRLIFFKLKRNGKKIYGIAILIFILQSVINTSIWSSTMICLMGIAPILLIEDATMTVVFWNSKNGKLI